MRAVHETGGTPLARNIGLNSSKIKDAERIVESRQQETTDA